MPAGPKIAVIGNCQGRAVANAIRLLAPEAQVDFVSVFGLPGRVSGLAGLRRDLAHQDAIFAGRFTAPLRDGGTFDELRADPRLVEIPVLVFAAFHPDLVYVSDLADRTGRRLIQSGTGDFHSALVLFAYLEGFDDAATARLFSDDILERLGYLDLWDASVASLLETGRLAGHDMSADLMRWTRRGLFMHATNHPRMFVAADLARRMLRSAGIPFVDGPVEDAMRDEFIRLGTWPVYPAIASRYGVPPSELFLTQAIRTGQSPRTMDLPAFIAASFVSYRRHGRSDFSCPRVTAWRTDPAIWRALWEAAKG